MYLPLAITLLTELIFLPFAGTSDAEATFYYGHSYTGNALACAAAKASPEILEAGVGAAVCLATRPRGLPTRPIRNMIVLVPPFCITLSRLRQPIQAIGAAIIERFADKVSA